jgi:hypothetical protein
MDNEIYKLKEQIIQLQTTVASLSKEIEKLKMPQKKTTNEKLKIDLIAMKNQKSLNYRYDNNR